MAKANIGNLRELIEDSSDNVQTIFSTWNGCMNSKHQINTEIVQAKLDLVSTMITRKYGMLWFNSLSLYLLIFPTLVAFMVLYWGGAGEIPLFSFIKTILPRK